MLTVVVADDHPVVRQGLRTLLETEPGVRVVGEASDGLEALGMVERHHPRVLLLDLMMPHMGGLEVTRRVRREHPDTAVVILSMHSDDPHVVEALRAGALAYVLKDAAPRDVIHAVREAAQGRRFLSPPLSERLLQDYMLREREAAADPYDSLSPREREILQMVAEGRRSREIAEMLHLSRRTVETHRANLMRKLGLRNQGQLIHYAARRGILPPGHGPLEVE